MQRFEPHECSERENYKVLTGSIIPRPIAFITSESKAGALNAAPFSYFNIVTADPPMLSIAIQRQPGKQKDTAHNILTTEEFVVHIVDESIIDEVNETSATLDHGNNELQRTKLSTTPSRKIQTPAIKEAKVRFECRLEQHIPLGGNDNVASTDLIIGKIVCYHVANEIYSDGKINPNALQAVSRLAGANYATLGTNFAIERPK